jgi:3-oxoacyl-[acyl-carrier protein] reductase
VHGAKAMSPELQGQVALVTGASRGIGRAIARRLAVAGARVFVNYVRQADAAAETVRLIRGAGGEAEEAGFDVADPEAAAHAVESICKAGGRLDVLVNNAGVTVDGLVLRLRPEDWARVIRVNLDGTFHCSRAALKPMVRQRYGRIVNLSSVIGLMGNAGQAAYAAAKAGVMGFTKSTAREVASRGITVNAVAPGLIQTEMLDHLPAARRSEYLSVIPAGRLGTVEEVADVVGFLARRESGYVTGQVIGVNGGLYM